MSCFQRDLDIPHMCHEGISNARWGWNDELAAHMRASYVPGLRHTLPTWLPAVPWKGSSCEEGVFEGPGGTPVVEVVHGRL